MNEILMTNVFFVITGSATIIITILGAILLVYGIITVHHVYKLSRAIRAEGEEITQDVQYVRQQIKASGLSLWETLALMVRHIRYKRKKIHEKNK